MEVFLKSVEVQIKIDNILQIKFDKQERKKFFFKYLN